ncbi:MAG: hypothetical protein N3B21_12535 [Clostridia bacterium]|nr:hypothetical protein [Clostridia bacterium]
MCRCNNSSIRIIREDLKHYTLKMPCIGCGNEHAFVLGRREMFHRHINSFCCSETGVQQCFLGNDEEVRKKVDNVEKELDELINMFGYDSYFKNTQVMFDTLNRIHDIAEQGNLSCECGNNDIELIMLSDKIHLKCSRCSGTKVISAASNEDLKNINLKKQILLMESTPKSFIFEK